ncbi:hypothetical protein SAY86_031749 [Trapa natans]|uniref:Uncharacterized protein n=1 Tax=Trapa natans TaxID=22666 RepID=A0AAN7LRW1_TRANT|nr:hypothetical protein SAY86_031749 [Trapa natans]
MKPIAPISAYKYFCYSTPQTQASSFFFHFIVKPFLQKGKLFSFITAMAAFHHVNFKYNEAKASSNNRRKGNGIIRKCASLVRQQRARIYILRRCATMLLRLSIQGDD